MLKYFGIDSSILKYRLHNCSKHLLISDLKKLKHGAILTGKCILAPILFCAIVHEINSRNQSSK